MARDRTIKPETTADRADRLRSAVDRAVVDAKPAALHQAINLSIKVAHDTEDVAAWLNTAYDWLEARRHLPDFTDREDRWIAELATYEALYDALSDAKARL